jgi:hypothetical protein
VELATTHAATQNARSCREARYERECSAAECEVRGYREAGGDVEQAARLERVPLTDV